MRGVAVIGAGGQLGTAFCRLLGDQALAVHRDRLDLGRPERIPAFLEELAPEAVVNCAAYTKVDDAENEERLATRINTEAVGAMARWAGEAGRPFLTFSTDYVFNGEATSPYVESHETDPINAYGRSKLGGERLTVEAGGLVVRTSWVISGSHPNFAATMIRLAPERALKVVDDQIGCPTVAQDLARGSYEALRSNVAGLLHLVNQGPTTWFGLARAAVREAGLDPALISPCSTEEYPTPAKRPAYSVLGSERLDPSGLEPLPAWEESLPELVSELKTWI